MRPGTSSGDIFAIDPENMPARPRHHPVKPERLDQIEAELTTTPQTAAEIHARIDCWSRTHIRLVLLELVRTGRAAREIVHGQPSLYRLPRIKQVPASSTVETGIVVVDDPGPADPEAMREWWDGLDLPRLADP